MLRNRSSLGLTVPVAILLLVLLALCLSGCAVQIKLDSTAKTEAETVRDAIELSLWSDADAAALQRMTSRVQRIFPDLALTFVHGSEGELAEMTADGNMPDLFYLTNRDERGTGMSILQSFANQGKIVLIPSNVSPGGLYYNVDLFDRFGVPYPEEGMNWDDTVSLMNKFTREDNDVSYYGFGASIRYLTHSRPWSMPLIDRNARTAIFNNDQWAQWFGFAHAIMKAGGTVREGRTAVSGLALFLKEKTMAMWAGDNILYPLAEAGQQMNWDVTMLPAFRDTMTDSGGVPLANPVPYWAISQEGADRDVAALLLVEIISPTSSRSMTNMPLHELAKQLNLNKTLSILQSDAKKVPLPPGKFPLDPDVELEKFARDVVDRKLMEAVQGIVDPNTALREAEEIVNLHIQTLDGR